MVIIHDLIVMYMKLTCPIIHKAKQKATYYCGINCRVVQLTDIMVSLNLFSCDWKFAHRRPWEGIMMGSDEKDLAGQYEVLGVGSVDR